MAYSGNDTTGASAVDAFLDRLRNQMRSRVDYWSGNTPSYMDTSNVGGRSTLSFNDNHWRINGNLDANSVKYLIRRYARFSTEYRRIRYGLRITSPSNDISRMANDRYDGTRLSNPKHIFNSGSGSYYWYDGVGICRMNWRYRINYSYHTGTFYRDQDVDANDFRLYIDRVEAKANNSQFNAGRVDLRVCHSSCHSDCHGSRGRR